MTIPRTQNRSIVSFPVNTILANAKVNLSLAITGRRGDGYHNLLSIYVPVSLYDRITICEAEEDFFTVNNPLLLSGNIIGRVVEHIRQYVDKNFSIDLEKNIPVTGGFGGASSDATAVLQFFNKQYDLNFSKEKLHDIALSFGADCPFFLRNKPVIVGGKGERISEISGDFCTNLAKYRMLLFKPKFGIPTWEAYHKLKLQPNLYTPEDEAVGIIKKLIASVNSNEPNLPLFNTFSKIAFPEHKEFNSLLDALPCPMMLSGSGSGCFCLFQNPELEPEIVKTIKTILGDDVFIKSCKVL